MVMKTQNNESHHPPCSWLRADKALKVPLVAPGGCGPLTTQEGLTSPAKKTQPFITNRNAPMPQETQACDLQSSTAGNTPMSLCRCDMNENAGTTVSRPS